MSLLEMKDGLIGKVNGAVKWVVSGSVAVTLAIRWDLFLKFMVLGAMFSAFLCKTLKIIINQDRPENQNKIEKGNKKRKGKGMPSDHAQSLAFLSHTFILIYLLDNPSGGDNQWEMVKEGDFSYLLAPFSLFLIIASVSVTSLRVICGDHTFAQVAVGYLLGWCCSTCWFWLWLHCYSILFEEETFQTALTLSVVLVAIVLGIQMKYRIIFD